ncbi:RICIN domain-containing protein [Hymenobacter weizhouensis]|uniref:RICIN domain-containing protein n=1 Tax=Hymenobacter sp. YIM 151500-1 TaxID=2987689 RepID=UPI002225C76B|nr:RICIN domain-containing protein [Hymenobacter sp. YIM 151500-1]UYZ62044.1 RICIN domain-containing protein [Hymenobacter sp. YIM 151500-1]
MCRPAGLLVAALILGALDPDPAQAQVAAKPADSFVESIGVNTHWSYPSYSNYAGLKQKLSESGIRYIRDSSYPGNFDKYNELYSAHGIRTNVLLGRRLPGDWPQPLDLGQIGTELSSVKSGITTAAVASLEAPNEYDLSHGSGESDWVGKIQQYTKDTYAKAKADATLKNLPLLGPSLTSGSAYSRVGNMDPWIDYVNLHPYQSDRHPGSGGWGDDGYGSIYWHRKYGATLQSSSGKPTQATECGYHNDLANDGLSEEAAGKYTARMYAEFFRTGFSVRSFKYELLNQGTGYKEDVFGLLRNDLTEKPSFRAVKNLISVLSDKGTAFTPGSLNYTLTGNTNNVRQLLFQKRNGDFYLMLWLEVPSWDVNANKDLYPAAQTVTLTLPGTIKSATKYELSNNSDLSTAAVSISGGAVTLSVSDKVMIVKLSSGTVTSVPGTPTTGAFSGVYRLVARHSGKVLDISGASTAEGAAAIQWTSKASSNQHWQLTQQSNGSYKLVAQHSGKCLDVNAGSTADGAKVQQWTDNGTNAQRWEIKPASDGYYTLTNVASGKVLDVAGGVSATGDGVKVHMWTAHGNTNQQWKLELVSSAAGATSTADQQTLSIYPNPIVEASADPVTVQYVSSKAQTARLMVVNSQGVTVYNQVVQLRAGLNKIQVPASQKLHGGVHVVRLATDAGAFTQRLQVAR